jgi:hypothetical protein
MSEVTITTAGSPFAYAASELSTSAAILKHRRGKFVTNNGDLALGSRMAVLTVSFGWVKFCGAGLPIKLYATPDHPKPARAELGDTDKALWSVGPDGKTPTDPWVEFVEAIVVQLDSGTQYTLSATAPTARNAMGRLASQIAWGQRVRGPGAVAVITLASREVDGAQGVYNAPVYDIVDWITGNGNEPRELPAPNSPPKRIADNAGKGVKRAQDALKKRLSNTDNLDDEVPY